MNTTTKKNRNIFEVLWTNNRLGFIATIITLSIFSIYFLAAMILPKVYPETNWNVYNIGLALIIGTLHVMAILYIIFSGIRNFGRCCGNDPGLSAPISSSHRRRIEK